MVRRGDISRDGLLLKMQRPCLRVPKASMVEN